MVRHEVTSPYGKSLFKTFVFIFKSFVYINKSSEYSYKTFVFTFPLGELKISPDEDGLFTHPHRISPPTMTGGKPGEVSDKG